MHWRTYSAFSSCWLYLGIGIFGCFFKNWVQSSTNSWVVVSSVRLECKNRRLAIFILLMDLNKFEYHKCSLQSLCISLINLQGICKWSVSRDCHLNQVTIVSGFTLCSMMHLWCAYIRFDVGICRFRCRSVISSHHPNWQSYQFLLQWRVIFVLETANDEIGLYAFEYRWFKDIRANMAGAEPQEFYLFVHGSHVFMDSDSISKKF